MQNLPWSMVAFGVVLTYLTACGNKDATPTGKVILDWDPSQSTRPSFPKAKIGARTKHDLRLTIAPPAKGGPSEVSLTFDTAPVDLEESGKTVHHLAVVSLEETVTKNTDWTITGNCKGPDYQPGPVSDGKMDMAEAMVLPCFITLKYGPSFTYGVDFWIMGDGTIRNEGLPTTKLTVESANPP